MMSLTARRHVTNMTFIFFSAYVKCTSCSLGPKCCRYFRKRDRDIHGIAGFPNLFYNELYVMDGGFKQYYHEYPEKSSTGLYVPMTDKRYISEWKQHFKNYKQLAQQQKRQAQSLPVS